MNIEVKALAETYQLGEKLGELLTGGEVIELVGDIGAGKTALTKGIAKGLGIDEDIQSPTFTISRTYESRGGLVLSHYDFYRLNDAGIMKNELAESIAEPLGVTIIEWSGIVEGVLPAERLKINILSTDEDSRRFEFVANGKKYEDLVRRLE